MDENELEVCIRWESWHNERVLFSVISRMCVFFLFVMTKRRSFLIGARRVGKMDQKAFQEYYPDELSHCYGCGRLNDQGHQIKTYWDGDETVTLFQPLDRHISVPGFVYGGLIASLIDCHSTGTASAAAFKAANRAMGTEPPFRFVTASLTVDYLKPTPLGVPLEIRGRVEEIKGRKVVVVSTVSAQGTICARGRLVAVEMPDTMSVK